MPGQPPHPDSLKLIAADYRAGAEDRAVEDRYWRADGLTVREAARRAALSRIDGKIHPHQRRLGGVVLAEVAAVVFAAADDLAGAGSFEALHAQVTTLLRRVHGAGPMVAYDVSDRLGRHLGLAPEAVHLHRGTADGARNLGLTGSWIRTTDLPGALQALNAREAEDVLCSYKRDFFKSPDELAVELAARGAPTCGRRRRTTRC